MKTRALAHMTSAAALLAAVGTLFTAAPADACGGFFCNNQPVDQTGENILFVQDGDEIEAHVNIFYQGDADDFAWIVPTPSRPEINISTRDLFTRLDQFTGVRYFLNFQDENCLFFGDDEADFDDAPDPSPGNDGGVTVVQQSSVGPYDFAVLQATSTEALFAWLQDNDYDLPNDVMPFVEPYVNSDNDQMHFVAFRLQSDREVGDIAPVRMRYQATAPMVPIKLTGIAAQDNMGVRVHVLSNDRAVPENYLHVHVNEARIDWMRGGSNYNDLVTEAMDEAGGQGFTTEYAGPSDIMAEALFREGMFDTERLAELSDPVAFMNELMSQAFQGNPQLLEMLRRYLPIPETLQSEGIEERDFYNCVECYAEFLDRDNFDAVAFANDLESSIVEPLRHVQGQFDATPYLSRLFTTLSADEMSRDPGFGYNANMADVSNVRTADATADCDENGGNITLTITLSDGRTITQAFDGGPIEEDDTEPAADLIEETSGNAPAAIVRDINSGVDRLDEVLDARDNEPEPRVLPPPGGELDSTFGCATAPGSQSVPMSLLLLALGLFVARRRR